MLAALLVALLCVIGSRTVGAVNIVTVRPNDPSIVYGGSSSWSLSQACGGTQYSFGTGTLFTFSFVGTALQIVGTRDAYGGDFTVNIDGQSSDFNRSASVAHYDPNCNSVLYTNNNLPSGQHTLIVSHETDKAGTTAFFEWQYLQYANGTITSGGGSHVNAAAIGGGIGGGVGGILLLSALFWFFFIRKKRLDFDDSPVIMRRQDAPPTSTRLQRASNQVDLSSLIPEPFLPRSDASRLGAAAVGHLPRGDSNITEDSYLKSSMPMADPYLQHVAPSPAADKDDFNPYAITNRQASGSRGPSEGHTAPTTSTSKSAGEMTVTNRTTSPSGIQQRALPLPPDVVPPMSEEEMNRLAARVASMVGGQTSPSHSPTTEHRSPNEDPPEYTQ